MRVELKADKVEFRSNNGSENKLSGGSKTSGSETSLTSHGAGASGANGGEAASASTASESKHGNRETCIMFKLSLPSIVYYKQMDNFTERSFISNHNVTLEITKVENKLVCCYRFFD